MATLIVNNQDFRGQTLLDIDRLEFGGSVLPVNGVVFSAGQFGAGKVSLTSVIVGEAGLNGNNRIDNVRIEIAPNGAFSAGSFTYQTWDPDGDTTTLFATARIAAAIGGDFRDEILLTNGAGIADGGGGDDIVVLQGAEPFQQGDLIDGGANSGAGDILRLDRTSGPLNYVLSQLSIVDIEHLEIESDAPAAINLFMTAAQLAPGQIASIKDNNANSTILLHTSGLDVDLSHLILPLWDNGDIVEIAAAGPNATLVGTSQNDRIIGAAAGNNRIAGGDGRDTMTGGNNNDIFTFRPGDAAPGEIVDGAGGTGDRILIAPPPPFTSSTVVELSQIDMTGVEVLEYTNGAALTALLRPDQIGTGKIATVIGGTGVDTLAFKTATLDLTSTIFQNWTIGVDTILVQISGNAAAIAGSAAGETLRAQSSSNFDGAVLDGNGGIDTLFAQGGTVSFVNATLSEIERLEFIPTQSARAVFTGAQFGGAGIVSVNGNAQADTLEVTGLAVDLSTIAFNAWTDGADTILLTGTAFADNLTGSLRNDRFDSQGGIDTLRGLAGNDTYVNPGASTIVEQSGQGTDTIESNASFTLGANIERLFLTGSAAIDGTGNALANHMLGNDKANALNGRDGNDTINGGGGSDTINGGSGLDRLIGGLQRDKIIPGADTVRDTIVYTLIGESTGQTRDVITGLDLNAEDKIDLPGTVSSIAAARSGALSLTTFNQNLASAFNAAALPVNGAALFTPTSGDLVNPNMVYLIVDANGVAGYQANQDWVFQLENHTGTLDIGDFI